MRARTAIVSTVLAVALLGLASAPAHAVDDPYTPIDPDGPSLVGSSVSGTCVGDVPYIDYSVVVDDPNGETTNAPAWLTISGSGGSVDVPLGTVGADGTVSGRVLWPGAAVDGAGNGTAWPGFEYVNGSWVYTGNNMGWTRGAISATIHVNPSIAVPLSYPAASGACNPVAVLSEAPPSDPGAQALAATGAAAPYLAIGLGAAAVAAGAVLLIRRRATR